MAYSSFKVREIVDRAVQHDWSVPEFQRGFVWKSTQVRDLAESLWRDYPVGSILIWDSTSQRSDVEPRGALDAQAPTHWLVDGQQRTTALCILSGRKPYWWREDQDWNDVIRRNDVRFDIDARQPPYFLIANAAISRTRSRRYVPIRDLLVRDLESDEDQRWLTQLARDIKADGLCDGMDAMEVKTRLERVCRIRGREVVGITVDHDLEEVVEIFARLNSKGTRVKEADIYLGYVAARAPGWVRDEFMPFLDTLEQSGFEVTPNLLFQSLTAVGAKRVRFKQVDDRFWNADQIQPAWKRTREAWRCIIRFLEPFGVLTNAIMPSDAVFVTLAAFFDKFPHAEREGLMEWLLQALRYGRYSAAGVSSLDEDLREIEAAETDVVAVSALRRRIRDIQPFSKEEFLRDYSDTRFGRLMLYLLVFGREALDWDSTGDRIAFDGSELERGYKPQFHHIFPRAFLEGKAAKVQIEALANIAIIGPSANIRISAQAPLAYFERYSIGPDRRSQQLIEGQVQDMTPERFPDWLEARAQMLAEAAEAYVQALGSPASRRERPGADGLGPGVDLELGVDGRGGPLGAGVAGA